MERSGKKIPKRRITKVDICWYFKYRSKVKKKRRKIQIKSAEEKSKSKQIRPNGGGTNNRGILWRACWHVR